MACVLVKKRKETNKTKSTAKPDRKKLIINDGGTKDPLAKPTVNDITIKTKNGEILEFEIDDDDILETILNLIQPNNDDDLDDEDVYDDCNVDDEDNYSDEEEHLYFRGVMTAAAEHCHDYGIKKI